MWPGVISRVQAGLSFEPICNNRRRSGAQGTWRIVMAKPVRGGCCYWDRPIAGQESGWRIRSSELLGGRATRLLGVGLTMSDSVDFAGPAMSGDFRTQRCKVAPVEHVDIPSWFSRKSLRFHHRLGKLPIWLVPEHCQATCSLIY